MSYAGIILTFVFVNNFVLTRFLGLCPVISNSDRLDHALGLGAAVTFIMSLASLGSWLLFHIVLQPLGIEFLQTVTFVLISAGLVQLTSHLVSRFVPVLERFVGSYFSLITTNCAVLGITLIAVRSDYNAGESLVAGISAGAGFVLALLLVSTLREKLDHEWVPEPFRGTPIAFISMGLMAMAFMAFDRALLVNLVG